MSRIITFIKKLLRKTRSTTVVIDPQHIIPRNQHRVSKTDISANALKVLNRLNSAGFQAYLVGGSVRDLLLHKAPKDFDVATNATPSQIRALFRNARIIGRRFKLAHIIYGRDIIEVATFRGEEIEAADQRTNVRGMLIRDNVFGTFEQDAWRRDFTINSLYYNIQDGSIVDFTGGVLDINERLIRIIGEPIKRYQEDPVRMLRAIRFSAKLNFNIATETASPMLQLNTLITHISGSRLFDEITKLYQCGASEVAHNLLIQYKLFPILFTQTYALFDSDYPVHQLLLIIIRSTDRRILENKPVTPAFLFAVFLWFPLRAKTKQLKADGLPALAALEKAMSEVIAEQNRVITVPKRYTQIMREMWIMQYRLPKRTGNRAFQMLQHPRFRAAYDLLIMRAEAGDEDTTLADWWTTFQAQDVTEQMRMVQDVSQRTEGVIR